MTHDHLSMLDAVKSDGLCECECAVVSVVQVGPSWSSPGGSGLLLSRSYACKGAFGRELRGKEVSEKRVVVPDEREIQKDEGKGKESLDGGFVWWITVRGSFVVVGRWPYGP